MPVKRLFILVILWLAACAGPAAEPEDVMLDTAVPPTEESTSQPTIEPEPTEVPMIHLPDLGPAAEFKNDTWLNTEEPVSLASLKGKVVLLEFWTFG